MLALACCGCATSPSQTRTPLLDTLQRGAMQTRELHGNFDTAYAATLSVLQDHGWQLDSIDKASGIIQAASLKRQDLVGPNDDWRKQDPKALEEWMKEVMGAEKTEAVPDWTRYERLTAHIEPWGAESVRERVTIVRCGARPSTNRVVKESRLFGLRSDEKTIQDPAIEQSVLVEEPEVYQRLFQEIQRAIFVRQGLTSK